jgi:hypothetical protein
MESSTFSSEYIVLKTTIDLIEALCYKLHLCGILIDGSTIVLCDNEWIIFSIGKGDINDYADLKWKAILLCDLFAI